MTTNVRDPSRIEQIREAARRSVLLQRPVIDRGKGRLDERPVFPRNTWEIERRRDGDPRPLAF